MSNTSIKNRGTIEVNNSGTKTGITQVSNTSTKTQVQHKY